MSMGRHRSQRELAYKGPERPRWKSRAGTVGRLVETGRDFYLVCRNPECRRVVKFAPAEFRARFPWRAETHDIVERARCTQCGATYPNVEGIAADPKVGTIADLLERQFELNIYCHFYGCHGHFTLSLDDLRTRWPREMTVQALMESLRCDRCAARWPDIECTIGHAGPVAGVPRSKRPAVE